MLSWRRWPTAIGCVAKNARLKRVVSAGSFPPDPPNYNVFKRRKSRIPHRQLRPNIVIRGVRGEPNQESIRINLTEVAGHERKKNRQKNRDFFQKSQFSKNIVIQADFTSRIPCGIVIGSRIPCGIVIGIMLGFPAASSDPLENPNGPFRKSQRIL